MGILDLVRRKKEEVSFDSLETAMHFMAFEKGCAEDFAEQIVRYVNGDDDGWYQEVAERDGNRVKMGVRVNLELKCRDAESKDIIVRVDETNMFGYLPDVELQRGINLLKGAIDLFPTRGVTFSTTPEYKKLFYAQAAFLVFSEMRKFYESLIGLGADPPDQDTITDVIREREEDLQELVKRGWYVPLDSTS